MRYKVLGIVLALACAFTSVLGATISGSVYDDSLESVNDVIIKISTEPSQTFISKNGSYAFASVPPGEYSLNATYDRDDTILVANEVVKVSQDGEFIIDLVLFPAIEDELSLVDLNSEFEIDSLEEKEEPRKTSWTLLILAALVGALIVGVFAFWKKKGEKNDEQEVLSEVAPVEDEELEKIAAYVKEHKRTTQKEIRQEFPLSEAKISLVLSQLEHEGKIKKLKKGRGNILIWNNGQ